MQAKFGDHLIIICLHLLCIAFVTQISFGSIQLIHVLFFIYLLYKFLFLKIYFNKRSLFLFLSFIALVTFSIFNSDSSVTQRILLSFIYLLSFVIFSINASFIINEKLISIYIKYALAYSFIVFMAFFCSVIFGAGDQIDIWINKNWGGYFFNYPNSFWVTIVPAYIILLSSNQYGKILLLMTSVVISLSRGGVLVFILLSFIRSRIMYLFIIAISVGAMYFLLNDEHGFFNRTLMRFDDRIDIFNYSKDYIQEYFWFGSGGRSLDILSLFHNFGYEPMLLWPHTHNFIMEIILRHGLFSGLLLLLILINILININNTGKFIFAVIVFGSLLQVHMFEFTYLIILLFVKEMFSKRMVKSYGRHQTDHQSVEQRHS
jgi:hypothetical protein